MQEKKRPLRALFEKHREVIMYLIFGGLTTLVSVLVYSLCVVMFRENTTIYGILITALKNDTATEVINTELNTVVVLAKVISWIVSVLFAFVTNKIWVFRSKSWRPGLVFKEAVSFFGGRALTGIFEIIALPLLISLGLNQTLFTIEGFYANIIVMVVVVILNYIISKFSVFKAVSNAEE